MSSPTATFEHAYYIGNYMSGILYGVELVMYLMTVQAFSRSSRSNVAQVRMLFWFSTIMLVLLTIDVSTNAVWGEQMWITFRDQPGGVLAYLGAHTSDWYEILGTASVAVMILMGDAFIIYRCYIIWGSALWIIVFPILMWLGTMALAICQLVASAGPSGNFFGGKAINFGLPYYTLSIALNVFMSSLIIGRIQSISKQVKAVLGVERAQFYTGVTATILESAAPYGLIGFMFLVPYGLGSDTAIGFGQVYAKMACLSPQFIVLRVAQGTAWDRSTCTTAVTDTAFAFDADKNFSNTLHSDHGAVRSEKSIHSLQKGEEEIV